MTTPTGTLTDAQCDALIRKAIDETWPISLRQRTMFRAGYAAGQAHPRVSDSEPHAQRQGQGEPPTPRKTGIISVDPDIMHGAPCIDGTRIPVSAVKNYNDAGFSAEHIMSEYPDLSRRDIAAALAYAAQGQVSASVPREPTPEMLMAAQLQDSATSAACGRGASHLRLWRAMYDAAPAPIPPAAAAMTNMPHPQQCEWCGKIHHGFHHCDEHPLAQEPAPPHAGQEPDALVPRLREPIPWVGGRLEWNSIPTIHARLIDEQREQAADRIEQLQAQHEALHAQFVEMRTRWGNAIATRDKAEAALARAVALLRLASISCEWETAARIDAFLASAKADERSDEGRT